MVIPLVLAVVMAFVMKSPTFLLFGLLSPVMLAAQLVDRAGGTGGRGRTAQQGSYAEKLTEARARHRVRARRRGRRSPPADAGSGNGRPQLRSSCGGPVVASAGPGRLADDPDGNDGPAVHRGGQRGAARRLDGSRPAPRTCRGGTRRPRCSGARRARALGPHPLGLGTRSAGRAAQPGRAPHRPARAGRRRGGHRVGALAAALPAARTVRCAPPGGRRRRRRRPRARRGSWTGRRPTAPRQAGSGDRPHPRRTARRRRAGASPARGGPARPRPRAGAAVRVRRPGRAAPSRQLPAQSSSDTTTARSSASTAAPSSRSHPDALDARRDRSGSHGRSPRCAGSAMCPRADSRTRCGSPTSSTCPSVDELRAAWRLAPERGRASSSVATATGPSRSTSPGTGRTPSWRAPRAPGRASCCRPGSAALALANTPEQLSVVFMDYKGGSAFRDLVALPHVVGTVTNLDARLAVRALSSLRAELTRRQQQLRPAHAGGPLRLSAPCAPRTRRCRRSRACSSSSTSWRN